MRRVPPHVLSLGLVLFMLAAARAAHAQDGSAILTVCNKGTVTVETVAVFQTGLLGQLWEIEGTSISPGACEIVHDDGVEMTDGKPAYLSTRLKVANGQITEFEVSADLGRANSTYVWNPPPVFTAVLPAEARSTREMQVEEWVMDAYRRSWRT